MELEKKLSGHLKIVNQHEPLDLCNMKEPLAQW